MREACGEFGSRVKASLVRLQNPKKGFEHMRMYPSLAGLLEH